MPFRHFSKTVSTVSCIALLAAFGGHAEARAATAAAATPNNQAVAEVAGQAITHAELEAHVAGPLHQIDAQRHQLLEAGLDQLITDRVLSAEAAARDISVEQLLDAEISDPAVSDADVDAFYQANQARIRQPKEQVAGQIRDYLVQQATGGERNALIKKLRAKHQVAMHLEPWREVIEPAEAPSHGPDSAPVSVILFSDFQCPGCRGIETTLDELRATYGDLMRLEFRQFPLVSIHPQAWKAAEAALCAGDQGRFWDMHASLFANQRQLDIASLTARAEELELDTKAFEACLASDAKKSIVERDMAAGQKAGVGGTPSIFVNGRPAAMTQGPAAEVISRLIDDELTRR